MHMLGFGIIQCTLTPTIVNKTCTNTVYMLGFANIIAYMVMYEGSLDSPCLGGWMMSIKQVHVIEHIARLWYFA